MDSPDWIPVATADGSPTLVSRRAGEACHSLDGAWTESLERYARAVRLRERALAGELARSARVLDVGTGMGWNLAAALVELEGTGVALHATSLEVDRGVIEATLALARGGLGPEEAERAHRPVAAALAAALAAEDEAAEAGVALGSGGRLRLVLGDARQTLPRLDATLRFDAVFLDPFSPRRDPALWERAFLADVAARLAPGALLSTYSAAFPVREALAAAGLVVGRGPRVGRKAEGTLASPDRPLPPLRDALARKLTRRLLRPSAASPNPPGEAHGRGA